jgi:hypothetical protein
MNTYRPSIAVVCLFLAAAAAAGCTADKDIRQKAADLDKQVLAFSETQKARISRLNQDYRERSAALFTKLEALGDAQLSFDRDHDAQATADDFSKDVDESSLPGRFADRLAAGVQAQRQRLLDVDAALQKSRDDYAARYAELKLAVNKLDDLHEQLRVLAAADNQFDLAAILIEDVQAAYNGLKAAQKQIAEQKQSTASKPPG